jgi:hypothetical protein
VSSSGFSIAAQRGSVHAIASYAADEFQRIAALSQALHELMKSPRFYASPSLAAAQLSVIGELAEQASVHICEMASTSGFQLDTSALEAMHEARDAFAGSSTT